MRARIDDCHWRLNSITTTTKNYNNDFTNLYRLHYSRHYRVLPTNVVIRQLNNTARKRNRNYLPDPKTLNGAKPDAESAIFLPVPQRDWNPSTTALRTLTGTNTDWGYCILYWGRPVSKSRQFQLSHIARNFEPTSAFVTWHLKYSLFDNRGHIRKYFTKDFQIPWLVSIYRVLMCLYFGLWTSVATKTRNLNKPSTDSPISQSNHRNLTGPNR